MDAPTKHRPGMLALPTKLLPTKLFYKKYRAIMDALRVFEISRMSLEG
jgi:hypothetical protein